MGRVLDIYIKQADAVNLIGGLVQADGISRLIGRGQREFAEWKERREGSKRETKTG